MQISSKAGDIVCTAGGDIFKASDIFCTAGADVSKACEYRFYCRCRKYSSLLQVGTFVMHVEIPVTWLEIPHRPIVGCANNVKGG